MLEIWELCKIDFSNIINNQQNILFCFICRFWIISRYLNFFLSNIIFAFPCVHSPLKTWASGEVGLTSSFNLWVSIIPRQIMVFLFSLSMVKFNYEYVVEFYPMRPSRTCWTCVWNYQHKDDGKIMTLETKGLYRKWTWTEDYRSMEFLFLRLWILLIVWESFLLLKGEHILNDTMSYNNDFNSYRKLFC